MRGGILSEVSFRTVLGPCDFSSAPEDIVSNATAGGLNRDKGSSAILGVGVKNTERHPNIHRSEGCGDPPIVKFSVQT